MSVEYEEPKSELELLDKIQRLSMQDNIVGAYMKLHRFNTKLSLLQVMMMCVIHLSKEKKEVTDKLIEHINRHGTIRAGGERER